MKCFTCEGKATESTTNHVVALDNGYVLSVQNVPCLRCKQCGEIWYTGTVTAQLEAIQDRFENCLTGTTVVFYPG